MIIDDHILIRETWHSLLATEGNLEIVAECGDGQLAIELAKNTRPNIVLLDINMAPMNGMDVLKMIRKLSPASKIIIVSMHSEPAYVKKLLRLGAKGYVTKTSPRLEMLDAIKEVNKGTIYICQEAKKNLSEQMAQDKESGLNSLSERQLQVLGLLSAGRSSKEIAAELGISTRTVEVHRHDILKKMKQKTTISLIQYVNSHAVELWH
ncbi:response regulator transcription factor [Flavitalea sp. BT771]|uniref:response regulator transcription factor n=1 Tax=Flavitalea sp. BT771 TaxID=3063329 RepID=UPI0026E2CA46|nr:response regulator transcription factor [Flavitalea sp. BT771]MDO6431127.1 response regulator transcription factor [Flavitalea sp. BT771]MDV6220034.1 response regulator transcription factor [Flavitalea sp. BT771]